MRKRSVTMAFGVMAALFFLQISCVAATAQNDEAAAPEALLADVHEAAGISCSDCHEETPPAEAVLEATCLTCHEDYKDLTAELYEDPHNAHLPFPDCGSCHHIHQPSENQCLACHAF